jgi:hypothetical protein
MRVRLEDASVESIVIKHVKLPVNKNHPRGWNTDISHQRKLKSYEVETTWYDTYSKNSAARLPHCLAIETQDDEVLMVLEDLDEAGYPLRKQSLEWEEIASAWRGWQNFTPVTWEKSRMGFGKWAPIGIWKPDLRN